MNMIVVRDYIDQMGYDLEKILAISMEIADYLGKDNKDYTSQQILLYEYDHLSLLYNVLLDELIMMKDKYGYGSSFCRSINS